MSRHTSGPWSISEIGCTNDGNTIIVTGEPGSDDRKPVAHALCQSKYKRGEGWKTQCIERDANARLIAAGPDSHAANLKVIEAFRKAYAIDEDSSDDWIYDELGSALSGAYFAARAAVAKATGETLKQV